MVARADPRPVRVAYAAGTPANFACLAEVEAAKTVLDLQVMLVSESREDGWTGEFGYLDRTKLNALLEGLDPSRSVALI